jgi:PAS domain S-box-containing protein
VSRSQSDQPVEEIVDAPVLAVSDSARLLSTCRLTSRLAGLVGVSVGLSVLVAGWEFHIESLKSVLPGYAPMAPNTAIGIILVGAALWLERGGKASVAESAIGGACAGAAALAGSLTLIEYFFGWNLHIDELLFRNPKTFVSPPTRMAAVTALDFLLLGVAVLLSRHRRAFMAGQYLVLVAAVLCLFNASSFLYGINSFYRTAFRLGGTTMAIHTSLTLGLLCLGVLFSRPDWGLMSTITSPTPGGVMSRRLLPGAVLIPCVFGWLRWQGQQRGLYDTAFGLTLLTAVNVVTFSILIWKCGKTLNGLDAVRAHAERNVQESRKALSKSEASFRQLADSMPQMVWTATANGEIDYYNQRWYEYTGTNFEQAKQWGWKPVLHPDDLQNTIDRWTQAFTSRGNYEIEYRFRRASDGAFRWHLGRARPILDAHGGAVRWFGTCTDIDDYKKAEVEIKILNESLEKRVQERTAELATANEELKDSALRLEYSNRELQDFASVASHDLQEPLRKVQAFGDRLKTVSSAALDAQGRDYLDRMLNASRRMQSLIQDLLELARVTSQASPFLPVDLAQVARGVLSDLEVRIAETGALVEVGDLPTIDADALQMRQLLQNLIGNALKFHQKGKPPGVRVYAEGAGHGPNADGMFRLIVKDNGIGFDEKYLDRIFAVFQRLHGRTEFEGTGIGLAICRKIAQRHGGDITAVSTPGHGASFLVTLPFGTGIRIPNGRADIDLGRRIAVGADSLLTHAETEHS